MANNPSIPVPNLSTLFPTAIPVTGAQDVKPVDSTEGKPSGITSSDQTTTYRDAKDTFKVIGRVTESKLYENGSENKPIYRRTTVDIGTNLRVEREFEANGKATLKIQPFGQDQYEFKVDNGQPSFSRVPRNGKPTTLTAKQFEEATGTLLKDTAGNYHQLLTAALDSSSLKLQVQASPTSPSAPATSKPTKTATPSIASKLSAQSSLTIQTDGTCAIITTPAEEKPLAMYCGKEPVTGKAPALKGKAEARPVGTGADAADNLRNNAKLQNALPAEKLEEIARINANGTPVFVEPYAGAPAAPPPRSQAGQAGPVRTPPTR